MFKVDPDTRAIQKAVSTVKQKRPPEDHGKKDQTTVAAFLPWRGSLVLSP